MMSLLEKVFKQFVQEEVDLTLRNHLKAKALAERVLSEEGRVVGLDEAMADLAKFSLGPDRHHDVLRDQHMVRVLLRLKEDDQLRYKLEHIAEPIDNPLAEKLIGSMGAKRAVLTAWLTYLRQNVGSCFATAPAIVIQSEQPHQFLTDMEELISVGRLKRVFGGVEYAVPLSQTGDTLLKAWEYTLASFAEAKTSFSKWNLYTSLGFQPNEPGGLAEVMRRFLQERLNQANRVVEDVQARYEGAYYQANHAQGRLQRASESEAHWLKMELKRRVDEMNALEQERDFEQAKASRLAGSLPFLIEQYTKLFPLYFQEVYDAQMVLERGTIFDDSPAGFRLLYKHGRQNPSQWTLVHGPQEFIDVLVDFFIATEGLVAGEPQMEGLERDLSDLIGQIVHHLRSDWFLTSALERMAVLHGTKLPKQPLKNLDKVEKKPWAYVSGGGMKEFLGCYYKRDEVTITERPVENTTDLLVFLLDTLKDLPASVTDPYLHDPMRSMLIQSPTHGFILKPGLFPFREGWLDRGNSSTWVRDTIVRPQEEKIEAHRLTPPMVKWVLKRLGLKMKSLPKIRLRLRDFRDLLGPGADALIYQSFPLIPGNELRKAVYNLIEDTTFFDQKVKRVPTFVTSRELYELCLALLMLKHDSATSQENLPLQLRQMMQEQNLALPAPIIFADTNWTKDHFGFVVNPGTDQLELWRTDPLGVEAEPMHAWFANSLGKSWGIYTNPVEYSSQ